MNRYPDYASLVLDWPVDRVLRITMSRRETNAMDFDLHHDIAQIWRLIDRDPDVSAVIVTGAGEYFSAGGDFESDSKLGRDHDFLMRMYRDAREVVQNLISCNKPIISAINGPAAGGGLVVALLADISIMAKSAKLVDGHARIGVAAGDHAALIWPLLCGMAKAKYYLMTCEPIFGEEAERIGLVSMVVDDDQLMERAITIATKLAHGAATGIRLTKQAMNGWLYHAWPIFEASLALETLGFHGPDFVEGIASFLEKRPPKFDPRSAV